MPRLLTWHDPPPHSQELAPLADEVAALREEVAGQEESLNDCLTSLGQEERKVGGVGWRRVGWGLARKEA